MIRNICFAGFSSSLRYREFMGFKGLCGIYLAYFRQPVTVTCVLFVFIVRHKIVFKNKISEFVSHMTVSDRSIIKSLDIIKSIANICLSE